MSDSYSHDPHDPHHHGMLMDENGEMVMDGEMDDMDGDMDGSSEDESPRENRVLTFADEHGKHLAEVHIYEPDPGEDNRLGPVGSGMMDHNADEPLEGAPCGKCIIL